MSKFIFNLFLLGYFSPAFGQTCVPPTNLTATNITQNSAILNWNTLSNAARYNLQWKTAAATGWTTVTTYTANTYNLTGLSAGTSYTFKVSVSCNGGSV